MILNKRTNILVVAILVAPALFSSGNQPPKLGPPVESNPKVVPEQMPAFDQQTRVHGIKTTTEFKVEILTDSLKSPWGLDFLPDGRMIVSEREGNLRLLSKDGEIGEPLNGVPEVRHVLVSGMTDVKLAPDFASSRYIFWSYLETADGDKGVNSVARGKLSSDEKSLEDVEVIYRTEIAYSDGYHTGSRMLFDDEGHLYITFGDRYEESIRIQAQHINSPIGKIIRINQDGTPAANNPFAATDGALKEIWSIGHRNPQGLAFSPVTGDLWSSEHGAKAGDEINIIRQGANYGWPIIGYGLEDNNNPINGTGLTQKDGMEQPVYYYDPATAPCGMTFYDGDLISEWKNDLFVGALRGSHIIRLVIDYESNRIVAEERLLEEEKQRFRHVVQGPDDALYAITDQGRLYRIGK
ncbi:MAG: PQQ-dependent sugar dehydrogenase [Petrimonas sp.]|nr:PQQ-dependent sugar dehydrogenase [Petrimonas sp.]